MSKPVDHPNFPGVKCGVRVAFECICGYTYKVNTEIGCPECKRNKMSGNDFLIWGADQDWMKDEPLRIDLRSKPSAWSILPGGATVTCPTPGMNQSVMAYYGDLDPHQFQISWNGLSSQQISASINVLEDGRPVFSRIYMTPHQAAMMMHGGL